MLKFGTFVSSIPDPNASECSSSHTLTKGTPEGLNYSVKGKAITDTPSKTKTPYLKKTKPLGNGSSVSGKKQVSQTPAPRLKINLISENKKKIVIPPISNGKGLLGPRPAHLKLKKLKGPDDKNFNFRNCRQCGLNTHIASKCSSTPKVKKPTKGKKAVKTKVSAKATVLDLYSVSNGADSSKIY